MPRISEERRDAQRRRIHEAALRVYLAKGFAGATIADIIKESGLSAGALYGYYSSKDELRRAISEEILTGRREAIEAAAVSDPVPDPAAMLEQFAATLPTDVIEGGLIPQLWGTISEPETVELCRNALDGLQSSFADYLTAWLVQEGADRRTARRRASSAAPVFMGVVQGYIVQSAVRGPAEVRSYFRGLRALLELRA